MRGASQRLAPREGELDEFPVAAEGAAEEFGGFGVVEDFLFDGVPFDGAVEHQGDEGEVARDGAAVSGFDGGDGGLAGFDAVEEIAMVAGGFVEAGFDDVIAEFGEGGGFDDFVAFAFFDHLLKLGDGAVVGAAVDVEPAFFADPFGAGLDVGVAASDDHGDVTGVRGFGAVFGGGVPDVGAGWHVDLDGADFGGAAAVHVEAPVGDVAVVADPVEELAAADVVVPAPVFVDASFDVGLHLGGADPHFVVEVGGGFGDLSFVAGFGEVVVAGGEADFDAGDFAEEAVADDFGADAEVVFAALPGTGLPDALVFLDGGDDGLLFGDGAGEGFFAVDVFAIFGGFDGDDAVPVVGDGEHDGVDVFGGHHFAIVVVGAAVGVFVVAVDGLEGGLEVLFVDVTGGDDLAVGFGEEFVGVAGAHHAPADDAHGDAIGGGVLAEDGGGDNGGEADGGGGASEELAA